MPARPKPSSSHPSWSSTQDSSTCTGIPSLEERLVSTAAVVGSVQMQRASSLSRTATVMQTTDAGDDLSSKVQPCYHGTCDLTNKGLNNFVIASTSNRLSRQGVCIWSAQSKTPFNGKVFHCRSRDMASSSVCRIPESIKIIDEQNAVDVDRYISVQRREGSPNVVMSVFQLRCSDARQYHKVYEELLASFESRGVYAAGKSAHGQGDPEEEIFSVVGFGSQGSSTQVSCAISSNQPGTKNDSYAV